MKWPTWLARLRHLLINFFYYRRQGFATRQAWAIAQATLPPPLPVITNPPTRPKKGIF